MVKRSPIVFLAGAGALIIVLAVLVYSYVQSGAKPAAVAATATVLVATRDIPARTVISADMIKSMEVDSKEVKEGSFRDKEPDSLTGKITKAPIVAGDQIVGANLLGGVQEAGFSGSIPPDKRAFTIAVNEITGLQGFVKPGDFVDVIGVFDKKDIGETASNALVQDVQVLAANSIDMAVDKDSKDKQKPADKMVSVTLAVNLDEAMLLGLASEKGKLHLALRPFQATGLVDYPELVKLDKLVGHPIIEETAPAAQPNQQQQEPPQFIPPQPQPQPAPVQGTGIQVIRGTKIGY